MNTWQKLLSIMQKRPERISHGQDNGVAIPSGFETEIRRLEQLEDQSQRDPRAIVPLIQVCKQIIERLQPNKAPIFYSAIQTHLGNAYWKLPKGDQSTNLTLAIGCYQQALRFYTPENTPLAYAGIQNNLGIIYSDLPTGDRVANLAQTIKCYQQALLVWTPETAPLDYASVQNNLGTAYRELPTGDRAEQSLQAIRCYQQALRFYTTENQPFAYAGAQNNLGLAYRELPTGDRAVNLALAIRCLQEALRFYTPEADPLKYALVQHNLGTAYCDLPTGDRAANLTLAIGCYQQALRFRTPEDQPFAYAGTQNNLGEAYRELPTRDRATNLEQAIGCYQQALRFYTPEAEPLKYAMTQNNLGSAYCELPTGDRAANLALAIRCHQQALRFYTPEAEPLKYAATQNNLGGAYGELQIGDQAANLVQAIRCLQEALRFYTPEAEPFNCRRTTHNLANLYFDQGVWDEALHAYRIAMDVAEQIYRASLSTQSKAVEVSESAGFYSLYSHAAFAAVRCGKPVEALLILERGKTRLLTEALHLRVTRPPDIPDGIWAEFEQAGAKVRAQQAENIFMDAEMHDPVEIYEARVRAIHLANNVFNAAIEKIRAYAPHFLEVMDFSTVEAQISNKQIALIAFCVTKLGSMGFVVSQHNQTKIQVVEVPTFTRTDLHRLFSNRDADGQLTGGWLGAYDRFLTDRTVATFETWQETITRVLAEIGARLLTPLVSALPADTKHLILLPSEELFLFPLHAVPLSGNTSTLLCDRYQVSYAPSIEVLADAQAKVRKEVQPELYAVINPENNLPFTPTEGEAIARLFAQPTVDAGRDGVKARVLAGMQERTYVHFSCHGSYNWNDPPASGLHLADDLLTLADLQQGTVNLSAARLVTLSACETGMTDVLRGSAGEYVGIPAGFLLAGVPCVIGSLWAVSDISTALLMERFYRNHLQGEMAFAAALREAQRWIRQATAREMELEDRWQQIYRNSNETDTLAYQRMRHYHSNPEVQPFAHPFYWAAFTINGV